MRLARRTLTRLWNRYGKDVDQTNASGCVLAMARLDPKLALAWSAEHAGRYDVQVRRIAAESLSETELLAVLDLLSRPATGPEPDVLVRLAERLAATSGARLLCSPRKRPTMPAPDLSGRAQALARAVAPPCPARA